MRELHALKALRRTLRRRRRGVTGADRAARERAIHDVVRQLLRGRYRVIAAYSAVDGEPDLRALLRHPLRRSRALYCPTVLRPGRYPAMRFTATGRWARQPPAVSPRRLDLVLVPLVGFDARGNRLGFGGGFYDRAFRHLRARTRWRKPKLVGIAFSAQEVASLPAAPWDVPLWGVITEHGFTRFDSPEEPETPRWPTG